MKNTKTASLSLRKLVLSVLVTAPLATLPVPLWALPSSATNLQSQIQSVSSGVTVGWTSATRVDVTSTATNSVIKWINFGDATNMTINAGDTINYALPSSTSSILNTVTGTSATLVNGTLSSNGNIYVLNPNGVTIGSTGVITANGVGLSTVPETEYNFLTYGTLTGVENQNIATTNPVTVSPGATITAASGTGNVWIAGKGANLAGTIDAGNLTVSSIRGGTVALGAGGDLTVGDVSAKSSTVSVTTDAGGTITSANNVTVYGPSVNLTTGNATITQNGVLMIGAGSPADATLTTNSGTAATDLENVQVNGTGTLTVNATTNAAAITVKSGAGKLAVGATGGALVTSAAGNLTLNAGNVTSVTATTTGGNILSGGVLITGGAVSLTAPNGANVALHTKAAPSGITLTSGGGPLGNVSLTQDTGTLTVPTVTAATITATAGNITFGGAQSATGTAAYTATGNVTINNTIAAGNVAVTAGIDINQSSTVDAAVAGAGNVTYTATAGNVTTAAGGKIGSIAAPASLTITAGKAVTLGDSVAATKVAITAGTDLTQNGTIDSTGTSGSVALTATAGNVSVGAAIGSAAVLGTAAPKTVTINAGQLVTIGAGVTTQGGGTVTATAGSDLSQTGAISTGAGNVTLTATAGNVSVGAAIGSGNVTVTGGKLVTLGGAISSTKLVATAGTDLNQTSAIGGGTGNVTLAATAGNVTIGNTIAAGNLTVTAGSQIFDNAAVTTVTSANLTATGNVAITAALTAPKLTLSGAAITESGAGAITSSGNATVTSTGKVTFGGANDFGNITLVSGNDATINDTTGIVFADGTNAAGNVTVTAAGDVGLGTSAAGSVTFGKNLTITPTGAGSVIDTTNNTLVVGNLTILAGGSTGSVTLDGASGNGVGLNSSYGQVNITTQGTNATVFESTVLNLGTVNLKGGAAVTPGNLVAYSGSGIINTGVITANNVKVGAGTGSAPGNISLTSGNVTIGNQITGTISIMDDLYLLNPSSSVIGNYLANNLTVVNSAVNGNLLTLTANVYGQQAATNIDLTTTGAIDLVVGQLSTTGTVALTSGTGAITATNAANTFTNVTVKSGGTVAVSSTKDLTVNSAGVSGTGTATYTSGGALTIGSYISSTTGATTFDTVTSAKAITDSVSGISIYGPVTFQGGSLSITNSGHSFGGVTINTSANNGAATIVESGTLKLMSVKTGSGAFTATSSNGDIIQTATVPLTTGVITTGNVTTIANNGRVVLDDVNNSLGANVNLTAVGNSTLVNSLDAKLGTVTVSAGTLLVDVSAASKNITQASGSSIYTYGATTFKTAGAGKLTLTNSGNQFGALTLTTGTGNIGITEQTTMNLKSVTTSGTFTATSAGGDIIDSGALAATGTTILAAPNGNILLTKSSDFGTVSFTTGGNVTITDANALQLDTSAIGGGLTVNAGGAISQLGALTVAGNTSFTTTGTLTLNNTANTFGAFRFSTAGDTLIDEATTFNLAAGSISTGRVTINTGGDFVTSGTGGSSFTGGTSATDPGLTINATGTIIPGAGSLLVTNYLKVNSPSLKDLSALSLSGNLNGKDPVNAGTGPYKAPSTP